MPKKWIIRRTRGCSEGESGYTSEDVRLIFDFTYLLSISTISIYAPTMCFLNKDYGMAVLAETTSKCVTWPRANKCHRRLTSTKQVRHKFATSSLPVLRYAPGRSAREAESLRQDPQHLPATWHHRMLWGMEPYILHENKLLVDTTLPCSLPGRHSSFS